MKCNIQNKTISSSLLEFSIISALISLFLSKVLFYLTSVMHERPEWLDSWHMCSLLEYQITRILGLNPGGLWEGGFLYPFHTVSLLFDEPSWGVSLLITPIWMFIKNIFPIFYLGGVPALFLSWIFTYYFVKSLGGRRIYAFYAGAMFCLSGISLILTSGQYIFWPFFLIPLLGLITVKIFSTSRLYWGILWGILFGYLAWSSAHIFVMGGVFLCFFILWNLLYNNHSRKTLLTLFIGFILSGIIAGIVLGSMYLTYKRFGFSRGYYQPYWYSSNWANLIYRSWPDAPFNLIAKTPFWEYLKANAKGETNIGISFLLLLSLPIVVITRLKERVFSRMKSQYSKYTFIIVIMISILFAFLNMHSLRMKWIEYRESLPDLAVGLTYLCYIIAGIIIYILRHRLRSALKRLDFSLLLLAFLFGFISFGPYYLTKNELVVASPVAFLIYHVPGFSGIQATSRWGLILSFMLSISVAMFLSRYITTRRLKICAAVFILMSFLEMSPGFRMPEFRNISPYKWTPRETDIFLKNLPDNGAVFEMESYPVEREQRLTSDNSLGYVLFSRLYHKKPLVTGYSSHTPHIINEYIFFPEDETLSLRTVNALRKFGARYWVFHIEDWSEDEIALLRDSVSGLKQIAELDNGKTLIYEDPDPKVSLTDDEVI